MRATALALVVASFSSASCTGETAASQLGTNPIRKVVNLLQQMQAKVTEEGEQEKALYETFQCYCTTGSRDLEASLSSGDAKITALGSDIEEASEKKATAEADLKQHQLDRDAAKTVMAEATGLREKEAGIYAQFKAEYDVNASAMDKAVKALAAGMAGAAFLQDGSFVGVLRKLASSSRSTDEDDRRMLLSFLSGTSGADYAPQSGQIVGILKQMQDEMASGYAEATATEEAAIKAYDELMAAKKKEVAVLSEAIETKTARIGELGVSLAQMKNDQEDTEEALAADKTFIAELAKSCATKTAEWEERSKTRADELVALADTIKVLNDDDALDLFKSTLGGPSASASFVEVRVTASSLRARALTSIKQALRKVAVSRRPQLDLIALALRGEKVGFEKVIAMIDKMVDGLRTEQSDDDHKKEYCEGQLDTTDDQRKVLERKVSDYEAAIASAQEALATLKEEIAALEAGLKALDKSVAEATEFRKAEHEEFNSLLASNSAAKEVLEFAKNRLNQFYNPKLHKAAPKRELSAEDRIAVNMGGAAPPTPAPGGIAGTGITVLAQVAAHVQRRREAPPPPPATFDAYRTKSEENNGVMAMIDLLIKDLDREMTEAQTAEKDGQADYEVLMADSASKRAADGKSLSEKEVAKANTEAALQGHTDDRAAAHRELGATLEYIASLHGECNWLLQYHGVRKEARASEIDALGKAKAVLSGADYSLVQTRSRGFLRGNTPL